MPTRRPRTTPRRRLFRRHAMGIPSVLFVAVLALAGFWWTMHAPQRVEPAATTQSHPQDDKLPRGCLVEDATALPETCQGFRDTAAALGHDPTGASSACKTGRDGFFVEVWEDPLGHRGLHWSLPTLATSTKPLAAYWVVAWAGSDFALAQRTTGAASGWTQFPQNLPVGPITAWAGSVAAGGLLTDGLDSIKAAPFALREDGTPRVAGYVNGGAIVLELPRSTGLDLVKSQEQLHVEEWTTDPLLCR